MAGNFRYSVFRKNQPYRNSVCWKSNENKWPYFRFWLSRNLPKILAKILTKIGLKKFKNFENWRFLLKIRIKKFKNFKNWRKFQKFWFWYRQLSKFLIISGISGNTGNIETVSANFRLIETRRLSTVERVMEIHWYFQNFRTSIFAKVLGF